MLKSYSLNQPAMDTLACHFAQSLPDFGGSQHRHMSFCCADLVERLMPNIIASY